MRASWVRSGSGELEGNGDSASEWRQRSDVWRGCDRARGLGGVEATLGLRHSAGERSTMRRARARALAAIETSYHGSKHTPRARRQHSRSAVRRSRMVRRVCITTHPRMHSRNGNPRRRHGTRFPRSKAGYALVSTSIRRRRSRAPAARAAERRRPQPTSRTDAASCRASPAGLETVLRTGRSRSEALLARLQDRPALASWVALPRMQRSGRGCERDRRHQSVHPLAARRPEQPCRDRHERTAEEGPRSARASRAVDPLASAVAASPCSGCRPASLAREARVARSLVRGRDVELEAVEPERVARGQLRARGRVVRDNMRSLSAASKPAEAVVSDGPRAQSRKPRGAARRRPSGEREA